MLSERSLLLGPDELNLLTDGWQNARDAHGGGYFAVKDFFENHKKETHESLPNIEGLRFEEDGKVV